MPNLYERVLPRGVAVGAPCHGATIAASGPNHVSLPGYIELLTGRRTSCTTNECPQITEPTMIDELTDRGDDVVVFGSWEHLDHAIARDPSRFLWSIARGKGSHRDELRHTEEMALLLEEGDDVEPAPGHGQYRPDRHTVPLALAYLKTHRPRFFYLALGDADEVAHTGDYHGYLRSITDADRTIGEVIDLIEADGAMATTTLLITVDHGRANDFESHGGHSPEAARVWLFAMGASIAPRGFVDAPKPRFLRDVAPTMRVLLGLPPQGGPASGEVLTELL
jgi:arylsulfatase A-like enzyme